MMSDCAFLEDGGGDFSTRFGGSIHDGRTLLVWRRPIALSTRTVAKIPNQRGHDHRDEVSQWWLRCCFTAFIDLTVHLN